MPWESSSLVESVTLGLSDDPAMMRLADAVSVPAGATVGDPIAISLPLDQKVMIGAALQPLIGAGPDGMLLTEDRPADHLHQRGLFWSWHQIRLGGDLVADGWFMKSLTFFVKQTNFDGEAGGAGVLTLHVQWIVNSGPEVLFIADEVTKVRILPLKAGARRLEFDTTITPLVDDLSIGGSDDAKGYGGFSCAVDVVF